jgi:putative hemolysin
VELLLSSVLFLFSFYFSATESSVYRANWIRLTEWAGRRVPGAGTALRLLDRQESTIVTILIGNNLVNTFASVIFSSYFARTFGPAWASAAVAIVVVITMVVGEYVPKSLGTAYPTRFIRFAAPPLTLFRWLVWPVMMALLGLSRVWSPPARPGRFSLTRQDFVAAMGKRDLGLVASGPGIGRMVKRLFRFSSMKVAELAIPIEVVKSVSADAGLDEVLAVIREHGYSRIPVWREQPRNIVGVIVSKDLLAAPVHRVRRISRVKSSARAMDALRSMQTRGEHLAVVEDETGVVDGIVSLEDLVEELVGEIRSEG